jgi:lysophospholipase L1-like esterase
MILLRSVPIILMWVATWRGAVQGPYPAGNPSAGPDLRFAFPDPAAGAVDQTFRLMVRPDLWGQEIRLRFANTFGDRPVSLDEIFVGMQGTAAGIAAGSNVRVTFSRSASVRIASGESIWSDPVRLSFVDPKRLEALDGRRLAVSFHVSGSSGPMTWHAKAMTTSYVTAPHAGSRSTDETGLAFPFSAASWFFLDAVDVRAPSDTRVIAALGDSITDGTATTMNGDDRWPDLLSRRLNQAYGRRFSVVNLGIGGNQVTGPAPYSPASPYAGGPSALDRLERDVFGVSGLSAIIWLEGINDLGTARTSAEAVMDGMRELARRVRQRPDTIRIFGATLTSSLGSANGVYGSPEVDQKRRALNTFIRSTDVFDGAFDFDAATADRATGSLRPEFQPNSTTGAPGDLLHPNRTGMLSMADAIDLRLLAEPASPARPAAIH